MAGFPIDGVFSYRPADSLPQDSVLFPGWFAISHLHLDDKRTRRRAYGGWCRIRSEHDTIFRTLRFSPNMRAREGVSELCIDWGAWLKLTGFAEDPDMPLVLTIDRIQWFEWLWSVRYHPDPAIRAAWILGLISLVLGIVSLMLAFFI